MLIISLKIIGIKIRQAKYIIRYILTYKTKTKLKYCSRRSTNSIILLQN